MHKVNVTNHNNFKEVIMSIHCNAKKEDIEKTVLMPGDPLRAKYIAENFLENPRLVNTVRNMLAYTGTYKGKPVTVFSSGMGMPSMGIYCYELFQFYGVENMIRIGSCGSYNKDLKLFDTILVDKSYTEGNFAYEWKEEDCHLMSSNAFLNDLIEQIENINLLKALKSLSNIEMTVVFLLFEKQFTSNEASKILEICSDSVTRIKRRAIKKLKNYMKGRK